MKPAANRMHLGALHALLAMFVLALGAQTGRAAQYELNRPIAELRLKDGTVLHGVTFVSVGASSITGKWDGGRGSIPLAQLPDVVRADLVPAMPAKPDPVAVPTPTPAPVPSPDATHEAAPEVLAVPLPTEIELTNGFVMHQCKVVSWRADAMTVNYVGGKVLVQLANVVPAQRALFVAHRDAVYARNARMQAAKAGKTRPAVPTDHEIKAAQIQAAIEAHQLVLGMTLEQVRMAYGLPSQTFKDPAAPEFEYWAYSGRGLDTNGAACDRLMGFNRGILDGWTDKSLGGRN
jgi:hypothetical protein